VAKVLIVDDEPSMREYLELLVARAGHQVSLAASLAEAKEQLKKHALDMVVSDFRLGKDSGIDVLKAARSKSNPPEVIIITAFGTPASAVDAMRLGAYDYICKPFDNDEFLMLVARALEKRGLIEENRQLKAAVAPGSQYLIGQSSAMAEVWSLVEKVAPTRSTVLITGESGTGKEVVARAIHVKSPRAQKPFVAVNCGAIAEGVLESELFGHTKGSFTGAASDRVGLLVTAGEGTVLLDEVGELPLATQVKLLRVLQERKVRPVGSSKEVSFEARILAATNRKLAQEVKAGRFREDLFFRLNVIGIELPPLRDRREDIAELAKHFLQKTAMDLGRPSLELSEDAVRRLEAYGFPGNVRQLQNIIERAATLSDTDQVSSEFLPTSAPPEKTATTSSAAAVQLTQGFSLESYLDDIERAHLVEALQRAGGVKMRAAQLLGMSFRALRYRLAKHSLGEREDAG
jgi:two-component system response regulator PilR (NtrC family)